MTTAHHPEIGPVVDQLLRLRHVVEGSDSIELKLTVPEHSHRSASDALGIDMLDAQIRQVYFFDTPDLALNDAGVVLRARRIQGRDHDSVVKLRPVVPAELPERLRASKNFGVEVDVMPGGFVCSGSLKNLLPPTAVRPGVSGQRPLSKLFSKEQRAFYAEHAPEGLSIDDLSVLGPTFVLKLKLRPRTFSRRLVVEVWLYPDGSRIAELSTKCVPGEGFVVAAELLTFLQSKGIEVTPDSQTKTKTALAFYAKELQAQVG